jgi:hypothetical protein
VRLSIHKCLSINYSLYVDKFSSQYGTEMLQNSQLEAPLKLKPGINYYFSLHLFGRFNVKRMELPISVTAGVRQLVFCPPWVPTHLLCFTVCLLIRLQHHTWLPMWSMPIAKETLFILIQIYRPRASLQSKILIYRFWGTNKTINLLSFRSLYTQCVIVSSHFKEQIWGIKCTPNWNLFLILKNVYKNEKGCLR